MKQLLLTFCIFYSFGSFSQGKKTIHHIENPDLNLAIKAHDSLVEMFKHFIFTLEIDSEIVNAYSHLSEFYRSNEVFLKDSIHAKKQLQILKEVRKLEGCGGDSQIPKILAKAKEYNQNGQKEKALELYKRGLILSEYDDEFKKEFEEEYEALKKEMEK